MTKATASIVLSLHSAGTTAPEWIHVIPSGIFSGSDGRGPYQADAIAVVEKFTASGRRAPIDENHAIDLAGTKGLPSPARGWITSLQAREDGVWGQVEWTDAGRELVAGHSYGFISPTFTHTAGKPHKVVDVLRVALTNDPNLTNLVSLHSKENAMLEELRKLLGLPETADEAATVAAVTAMHAAQAAYQADLGRIAEAAGAAKDAKPDAIMTALQGRSTGADENLGRLVISLQSQIANMQAETVREKSTRAIEEALHAGKIIPATKEHWLSMHSKDPTATDALLAAMPSLNSGGLNKSPVEDGAAPTAADASVISMMGIDQEAYAKTAKSLAISRGA